MKHLFVFFSLIFAVTSLPTIKIRSPDGQIKGVVRANNNDCPPLSKSCKTECYTISSTGCIVCQCPETQGVSHSGSHSTSLNNNNGCAQFPRNCSQECATIDAMGCIVCSCPTGSRPQSPSSSVSSSSSAASLYNNNGCKPFPRNCSAECVIVDSVGCIVCSCPNTGSTNSSSQQMSGGIHQIGNYVNTQAPGVVNNGNGCPAVVQNCPAQCTSTDSSGCIRCTCSPSSSSSSSSSSQGSVSSGNSGCSSIPRNCPSSCLTIDSNGCVLCSCPSSGATNPGSCPPYNDTECDDVCKITDAKGCIVCDCSQYLATTPVPGAGGCPAFDLSKCEPNCVVIDGQGCMSCKCPATTAPSSGTASPGTVTYVPGAGGCPSFDFSSCEPDCVVMDDKGCMSCKCAATTQAPSGGSSTPAPVTGVPGAGGCPSFDFSACDPNCVVMDDSGCLSCKCTATTKAPSGGSSTPGAVTSVPGAGGCPAFDFSACDPNCVVIDGIGCLSCKCSATTTAKPGQSTTPAPVTSVPGAGGCPSFDFSKCDPNCVVVDGQGCMTCSCAATSTANPGQSTTAPTVTSVPGAGGCPSFDFSTCDPNCVVMDDQGCMSCSCAATTTAKPGQSTTPAPVTSVPGAGGCPSFDFSTCDPNCVVVDGQGCMTCSCAATSTPNPGQSTTAPTVTSVPGAGGCPSFDFSTCDPNCVVMDDQGCMSCSCAAKTTAKQEQSTTRGTVTSVPGAGGCPSFDFSTCDPKCVVMDGQGCMTCSCAATTTANQGQSTTPSTVTSVPGAGGCPSFDFSTCDPKCVVMDGQGCMTCSCAATTTAKQGQSTTPSTVTSVPGAGGCPPFDFSTCDPNCVVMDGQGCMTCSCAATTTAKQGQSTTPGTVTSVPGAGGCPSFDFSTCDPTCVVMDGQGCMTCSCAATTTAKQGQSTTPSTVTSVPGAGGCPSFDFSTCDPKCVVMDGQGCMTCSCAGRNSPSVGVMNTTSLPMTAVPGAGGCPAFDFSSCDPNCVTMDAQGCLSCSCRASNTSTGGNQSGKIQTINTSPYTTRQTVPPTSPTRRISTPASTQAPTAAQTTKPSSIPNLSTTQHPIDAPVTKPDLCPPVKCLAPCNAGITFSNGCPICKCRPVTTTKP